MTNTPEFRIVRSFKAPRDLVWRAWTDPKLMQRWFGPKGSQMTVIRHDLRPGGILHSRMETPGGAIYARFAYREVEAPSRLVYSHAFADAEANVAPSPFGGPWPAELLTTVIFEEEAGGTRMTLTWVPIDATPEENAAFEANFDSMNGGWGGSFDQLDSFLAEQE